MEDEPIIINTQNIHKFKGGYILKKSSNDDRDNIRPYDAAIRIVKKFYSKNPEQAHNVIIYIKCTSKCKYQNWIFGYKIKVSKSSDDMIQNRLKFIQDKQNERAKRNKQEPKKINIKSNAYKYDFKAIKIIEIDHSKTKRDIKPRKKKKLNNKVANNKVEEKKNDKTANNKVEKIKVEEKKNDKIANNKVEEKKNDKIANSKVEEIKVEEKKNDKPQLQQTKNNKLSTANKKIANNIMKKLLFSVL
jgi:hypothetical protein